MAKHVCDVFLFVSENNKTAVHVCVHVCMYVCMYACKDRLFHNKERRIVT